MRVGSNLIQGFFTLVNFKKLVFKQFKNPPRNTGAVTPERFNRQLEPSSWEVDGFKLVSINQTNPHNIHLVFLHGGAYLLEANTFHRRFLEKLALEYQLGITIIDYPKAPEYTWQTTINLVKKAYLEITDRNPGNHFCILGDSAGGGLALALLQVLRDGGITPFPQKTVLISPWLDLSLSNDRVWEYERIDHLLPVQGLIYAGKIYSGGEDLRNPLLSPIYGDLSNLGEMILFGGTNEVFYPDCLALVDKISCSQGTSIQSVYGQDMFHDWVIFPLKESDQAVKQIVQFILAGTQDA